MNNQPESSHCAETMRRKGIVVSDKYSLKALATMSPAFEMHLDSLVPSNNCIIPNEVVGALGIHKFTDTCAVITKNVASSEPDKTHNLVVSKEGVLGRNPDEHAEQLAKGKAMYPTEGCIAPMNDAVKVSEFTRDLGSVIDFENAQILYRLRLELAALKAECERLDKDIYYETGRRNQKKTELANWQYWCGIYLKNRQSYRDQNQNLRNRIAERRRQIEEARKALEIAAAAARAAAAAISGGGGGGGGCRRKRCAHHFGRICLRRVCVR